MRLRFVFGLGSLASAAACSLLYDPRELAGVDDGPVAAPTTTAPDEDSPAHVAPVPDAEPPDASPDSPSPVVMRRCDGDPACKVLATGEVSPTELALRGSSLRWIRFASGGSLVALDLNADGGTPTQLRSLSDGRNLMQASSTYAQAGSGGPIYREAGGMACLGAGWVRVAMLNPTLPTFLLGNTSEIWRGTCGSTSNVQLLDEPATAVAGDLFETNDRIWFARPGGEIVGCQGIDGTTCPNTLARLAPPGTDDVVTIVAGVSHVVWATNDTVFARPKSDLGAKTGATVVLGQKQGQPKTLAIQGSDAYWTNLTDGTVVRAPLAGSAAPAVVLGGLAQPWGLVVTLDTVYVAEYGAGRILAFRP